MAWNPPLGVTLTVPAYDTLMLPVLRYSAQKTWAVRDLIARIADDLALSQDERSKLLPGGSTTVIASRIHWAKTYLKMSGLVEQPGRGIVQITKRGRAILNSNPAKIDKAFLQQFDEFRAFQRKPLQDDTPVPAVTNAMPSAAPASSTPEEQIAEASVTLDEAVRDALLARILEGSPAFFEKMIIDLLLAMGYGGSKAEAGEQLGGTGDGGIDGVIREDQLGLDRVYLQAKRYMPGNSVGSEAVQAFIGALVGQGAHKGVLITTSTFSKSAINVARQSGSLRLVLIDGDSLTRLMVRFNVGVRVARTVEIKRVDLDYFEDVETE